jgi:tryptophan 2,3-dioxygenase
MSHQPSGLTCREYLQLDVLLDQQRPRADPPVGSELMFITVHQVHELWFKLMIVELDEAKSTLTAGRVLAAHRSFQRLNQLGELLLQQLSLLETMAAGDFHNFRRHLGSASGLQSSQYHEMAILAGGRSTQGVVRARWLTDRDRARLMRRLDEPSVWDGYVGLLRARGLPVEDDSALARSIAAVKHNHQRYPELLVLATDLLTFDRLASMWRHRHALLAEQQLGGAPGTAGTSGVSYLRHSSAHHFYPLLWA